jgi:hypothetical protein
MRREIKTPAKEGTIDRQKNSPKRFKMTRDEVIEELMDEWWNSVKPKTAEKLIQEYLDDVGVELVDDIDTLANEMQERAKINNRRYLERRS